MELDVSPDHEDVTAACGVVVNFAEESVSRVHVDQATSGCVKVTSPARFEQSQCLMNGDAKLKS